MSNPFGDTSTNPFDEWTSGAGSTGGANPFGDSGGSAVGANPFDSFTPNTSSTATPSVATTANSDPGSSNPFDSFGSKLEPTKLKEPVPKSKVEREPLRDTVSPRASHFEAGDPEPEHTHSFTERTGGRSPSPLSASGVSTASPQQISDYTVRVVDYEVVNASYALYLIEVGHYGVILITRKRFSQLYDFYSSLGIKGLKGPARHLKNSLDDSFLRDRMREIQMFITDLMTIPNISKNPKFIDFFQILDIEEKKQDSFFIQQAALKSTHEELSKVTTERDSLQEEVDQLKVLKDSLTSQVNSLQTELNRLLEDHEALTGNRDRLAEAHALKERQVDDILISLRTLLKTNENLNDQLKNKSSF